MSLRVRATAVLLSSITSDRYVRLDRVKQCGYLIIVETANRLISAWGRAPAKPVEAPRQTIPKRRRASGG